MKKAENIKKPLYKKWWFWVIVVSLVGAVGSGLSDSGESEKPPTGQTETQSPPSTQEPSEMSVSTPAGTTPEPESETPEPAEISEPDLTFEFDVLQKGFISISENTTIEEILSFVDENSLFYIEKEYNKFSGGKTVQYKIAYGEDVSNQSKPYWGDCLTVDFDKDNGDKILNAQYANSHSYECSYLFYNYGTWNDFSDQNAEDYSGYYFVKTISGNNEGIVVKYNWP